MSKKTDLPVPAAVVKLPLSMMDPVAAIRVAPIIEAKAVPETPPGFRFMPPEDKNTLKRMAGNQRAESREALVELVEKAESLAIDLGRYAPDAATVRALRERMDEIRNAKTPVQRLLNYLEECEDVVHHDAVGIIGRAKKDLLHAAEHDPGVLDRYPAVMALIEQTREAIAGGRARRAAEKATQNTPAPANPA